MRVFSCHFHSKSTGSNAKSTTIFLSDRQGIWRYPTSDHSGLAAMTCSQRSKATWARSNLPSDNIFALQSKPWCFRLDTEWVGGFISNRSVLGCNLQRLILCPCPSCPRKWDPQDGFRMTRRSMRRRLYCRSASPSHTPYEPPLVVPWFHRNALLQSNKTSQAETTPEDATPARPSPKPAEGTEGKSIYGILSVLLIGIHYSVQVSLNTSC
jgi:hypothetical protein